MAILAMTAAEFRSCREMPEKIAWMACHFSPYGTGLTNLPMTLPADSLLILNDRTPIHGHDQKRIFQQLAQTLEALNCCGLLLDLQRICDEAAVIAKELLKLPCPVIVSEQYAKNLDCPVFLPPVPLHKTVQEHIAPWSGREIWLDAALNGEVITITENGSSIAPLPPSEQPEHPFEDEELHCHYKVEVSERKAVFTLHRTMDDLTQMLTEAKPLGITHAVGLYQELIR